MTLLQKMCLLKQPCFIDGVKLSKHLLLGKSDMRYSRNDSDRHHYGRSTALARHKLARLLSLLLPLLLILLLLLLLSTTNTTTATAIVAAGAINFLIVVGITRSKVI